MVERHVEMVWRCSSCRHQNLGRHMACQSCGNPKDESESYEMPGDPSQLASVTDPALLRMAEAGANWRCAYCNSNARDLDGSCKQCGAGRKHGANAPAAAPYVGAPAQPVRASPARRWLPFFAIAGAAILGTILFATCAFRRRAAPPPPPAVVTLPPPRTDFDASVVAVSWKRTITVEKWQLVAHEAFADAVPAGALGVTPAGQRVHHHEDVFDHDETVYDEVEVPDGFRTETYTERVQCGQDCRTTPRTCRQVCTPKGNGFASCKDECTGGTQACSPKYCNETRTRQIPKTRKERRPRTVKKYRSEPRYAAWVTYKTWEWAASRTESAEGTDTSPAWPDAGSVASADAAAAEARAPKPGDERAVRHEMLSVTFRTDDGASHVYTPATAEDLARFGPGTQHRVRVVGGRVTLL